MFDFDWISLDWIYWAISWILLRWHDLWDLVLPDGQWLGTTFDWVLAIAFLVITTRVLLFPLVVKQIKTQRAMQALQPKMKALQEKHKHDPETLRQEMANLYREEGVNPAGCLTIFLQIPVFFGLFHILRRLDPDKTTNTTLYGWTQEKWDSAVQGKLFGASIAGQFGELTDWSPGQVNTKVVAAVLVLTMMVTMYLTSLQMIVKPTWSRDPDLSFLQKLLKFISPKGGFSEDPNQALMQRVMLFGIPFTLLISGTFFPIGVVLYWTTTNVFSLVQQQWVLRKYPMPESGGGDSGKSGAKQSAGARTGKDGKKGGKAAAAKGGAGKAAANGEEPEKIDGKALAPRPGVKPVKPKKSNRKRKARR